MLHMVDKPKTPGQLAFEALEYVTYVPNAPASQNVGATTLIEAAEFVGVNKSTVTKAKYLLEHGTPEEIAAVKAGTMSLNAAVAGEEHRNKPLRDRGANRERAEMMAANGHVWTKFREAVEALASLPLPADVAAIAGTRKNMVARVNDSLPRARAWLEGFSDVWNQTHRTAQEDHAVAGDGDGASRKEPHQSPSK